MTADYFGLLVSMVAIALIAIGLAGYATHRASNAEQIAGTLQKIVQTMGETLDELDDRMSQIDGPAEVTTEAMEAHGFEMTRPTR